MSPKQNEMANNGRLHVLNSKKWDCCQLHHGSHSYGHSRTPSNPGSLPLSFRAAHAWELLHYGILQAVDLTSQRSSKAKLCLQIYWLPTNLPAFLDPHDKTEHSAPLLKPGAHQVIAREVSWAGHYWVELSKLASLFHILASIDYHAWYEYSSVAACSVLPHALSKLRCRCILCNLGTRNQLCRLYFGDTTLVASPRQVFQPIPWVGSSQVLMDALHVDKQ